MQALTILSSQKRFLSSGWLKGLGIVISAVIVAMAVFALMHTLKNIHYSEVVAVVERTSPGLIALALLLVVVSYGSLTIYDVLALRTIGHAEVPYRIAALASFTSYPIAHGIGAVALISPVIRYRIYVCNGLGALDVANICFLTGLTFWLGNLTAFGLSVLYEPSAISLIDYLPSQLNRWLAAALLMGVGAFVVWSWRSPRSLGAWRWPVRLPSGPMVLLQIVIGVFDLGAAALAMYVLIPAGADVGVFQVAVVFIIATLLGFASHAPAGIGVFDATILIGLGGDDKEPLVAALLMFRFLYHFLPFLIALGLFGAVEGWRSLQVKRPS
ncbi:YbhN family protein [Bradyrhizobium sp. dw_78]|uniref:lysylphosphatidylglycerol synthase transmembrane domain-containing protein n=1 Tax=Bradyrhizobium sp. dw_78 TaxID=2719793 RepID=UPI00201BD837|nr:YbhN family protein [Bradyrhizobium sp. dw_78]